MVFGAVKITNGWEIWRRVKTEPAVFEKDKCPRHSNRNGAEATNVSLNPLLADCAVLRPAD
jgi:hypothetical protein